MTNFNTTTPFGTPCFGGTTPWSGWGTVPTFNGFGPVSNGYTPGNTWFSNTPWTGNWSNGANAGWNTGWNTPFNTPTTTPWSNFTGPVNGWTNTPWSNTPWTTGPVNGWTNTPWTNTPWTAGPTNAGWNNTPWTGWNNGPTTNGWTNTPWTNNWSNGATNGWTNGFTPVASPWGFFGVTPWTTPGTNFNTGPTNYPFNGYTGPTPVTIDGGVNASRARTTFGREAA